MEVRILLTPTPSKPHSLANFVHLISSSIFCSIASYRLAVSVRKLFLYFEHL